MPVKFDENSGLVPAVIQDAQTKKVLMLGYMNRESLQKTIDTRLVTFYSRSRKTLWTKGETSGNFLHLVDIQSDCDNDTLLVQVNPDGPVCHLGTDTCWGDENTLQCGFLTELEKVIDDRRQNPTEKSYTASLFRKGINKIAQKVGEEAVEVIIEAKDQNDDLFLNESADLIYHFLVLLQAKNFRFEDVLEVLRKRHA
ncbi:bifunctional phosphoribosyl-AMP cyclohydrolase/phosphoribosyl-ATP diphosphatase HisIE [Candidatus Sulfidibacterium hydrothermale]|uniref:bifunctional phosphoribosyl-AMP cyclohydrolase/phosphoribosyl-ATP diphosphatase HisIE n=1 Tax=Candidatus Sulfidibacterium hydrothermale TaxID=2875962 RepID=UPI001F0A4B4E|nr:bifunctional phosphoribosyl-AMP cyclohydrolase/phosphoribosyl-ATP diphosphatase HisIE [Candidatus Sulfidibacterium hydrothermale]